MQQEGEAEAGQGGRLSREGERQRQASYRADRGTRIKIQQLFTLEDFLVHGHGLHEWTDVCPVPPPRLPSSSPTLRSCHLSWSGPPDNEQLGLSHKVCHSRCVRVGKGDEFLA